MSKKPLQTPILAIKQLHFEPGDILVIFTEHTGYSDDSMRNIKDVLNACHIDKDIPVLILHGANENDIQVQKGHEGQIPVKLTNLEYMQLMWDRKKSLDKISFFMYTKACS